MVYKVTPSESDRPENRFSFELLDGSVHSLPLLRYAPIGVIEELSEMKTDSIKFADMFLAFTSDGGAAAAVRKLDGGQLAALHQAYFDESGVTLPES